MNSEAQPHKPDTSELQTYIASLNEAMRRRQSMTSVLAVMARTIATQLTEVADSRLPDPPEGVHLLDVEPERLDDVEDFHHGVCWIRNCSCGWESKRVQYSDTAEMLGVAHLVDVGVTVDTNAAIRVKQGWDD